MNEIIVENPNQVISNFGEKMKMYNNKINTNSVLTEDLAINIKLFEEYKVGEDWTPAFKVALSKYDVVYIPKGVYKVSPISIPSNKRIYGDGDSTVIIPISNRVFNIIGGVETEVNITENVEDFSNIIKVNNTLEANDYILLRGVRDSLNEADSGESWCLGYGTSADSLIYGEFLEIESATPTQITTKNCTIFPWYYKDAVSSDVSTGKREHSTVQKVNFVENVVIENLKIQGVCNPAINVEYGKNVVIKNVYHNSDGYTDGMTSLVIFKHSLECLADECTFKINHTISPTQHYYVNVYRITSSQDCAFYRCKAYNTSQAFDVSYVSYGIPSINSTIKDCYSKNAQQTGMTTHQGSFISLIESNTIVGSYQGIYCRTKNSIITNNKIINTFHSSSTSYGIGIGESNTINCVISNNTISNARTGIYVTDGLSPESYYKYCGLTITNNTINNFITGIHINKLEPYSQEPMLIDITYNKLYSTRVSSTINLRGIYVGQATNDIRIEGNVISLRLAENLTYGIYMEYDVNNAKIFKNTIRKCKQGIYHRRLSALSKVNIYESENVYYDCTTNDNLTHSTVARLDNRYTSYIPFNYVSSTSNIPDNSCLFLYSDNTLRYRDKDGVLKTIATL